MARVLTLLLLFLSICGFGQPSEGLDDLHNDLATLSADEMEGRASGTRGIERARQYLQRRFRELSLDSINSGFNHPFKFASATDSIAGFNLIGVKKGQSAEIIVLTAHYDHLGKRGNIIFNGCDDNASGVAAMLFVADQLRDVVTNHTIIFVALDAEELGLRGAKALVGSPPFPLEQVVLNINLDMVSRSANQEIYACGTYHYPQLRSLLLDFRKDRQPVIQLGHDNPKDLDDDWTYSSDHGEFHRQGIPFVYFGVEDHEDYHRPSDTFDKVDLNFFDQVAVMLKDLVLKLDGTELRQLSKRQ